MHSISIFLIKQEDIRQEKINDICGNKETFPKVTYLGSNIYATIDIENFNEFSKNKEIGEITTDYFGGFGYQTSKFWKNGKIIFTKSDEHWRELITPINFLLKEMGVVKKSGMDEFDTINLGKYRTNEDFE